MLVLSVSVSAIAACETTAPNECVPPNACVGGDGAGLSAEERQPAVQEEFPPASAEPRHPQRPHRPRIVSDGRAVRIADGTQAGPGGLIICTCNDHTTEAGEPGRELANGDLLRVEAVTRGVYCERRVRPDCR